MLTSAFPTAVLFLEKLNASLGLLDKSFIYS